MASSAAAAPRARASAFGRGGPPAATTGGVSFPFVAVVAVDADEVVDVEAGLARPSSDLDGRG